MSQALTWSPQYPTAQDTITLTYNAALGNGALNGIGPVYMHTGIITNFSSHNGDWKHIPVQWDQGADSTILMDQIGPNLWQKKIVPQSYYWIGNTEKAYEMTFVFRDSTGSNAGKRADGSDFFISLYDGTNGYDARFLNPAERPLIVSSGDVIDIVAGATAGPTLFTLRQDGNLITQGVGDTLWHSLTAGAPGKYWLTLHADGGAQQAYDTIYYVVQPNITIQNPPSGTGNGITYLSNSSVRLTLLAPDKDFVYVIGDFNDWELDPAYLMKKTTDGERHWLEISGLTPGQEYRYQYWVEKDVRVADPWSDKLLDEGADAGVSSAVYPNLIDYPFGKTQEVVSILQPGVQPYNWTNSGFSAPDSRDLVVYELLIRDFVIRHDFRTVRDSLDYLQDLGVNAIELMPINEFDGNGSWGYSPNFWFAPDKYYGPKDSLKSLIDECHNRGIAVIMDMVFNHSFGLSPLVRMYQDRVTYKTTPDNPWFNVDIPHPYGLGHDFDHASPYTQALLDTVLSYWVNEYQVDGFRLDLSKGFTNNWTVGNIGAWSAYDGNRIGYLKRMANVFWNRHPGKYLILEHFADNSEETELANHGFLMWGKATEQYNQASMGWTSNSDFEYQVSYQARGWAYHNLVGFMESHDEERLMYENLNYGNAYGGYSTQDLQTALERMGQVAAFFLTIPGPKMIWQFGELGYDYSIEFNGRTGIKPIRWNYRQEPDRLRLYKIYRALIDLKLNNSTFRSSNYDISAWGYTKQIHVDDPGMNVTICGNFDVVDQWTFTGFQHTGTWYDYFTGQSLNVTDVNMNIFLGPGEYRIFTDQQLPIPDLSVPVVGTDDIVETEGFEVNVFPNPFFDKASFSFDIEGTEAVSLEIYDLTGRKIRTLANGELYSGYQQMLWDGRTDGGDFAANGYYLWKLRAGSRVADGKLLLAR